MATATVTANSVTITPSSPISTTGDYALFAFVRPAKSQASIMVLPPEIVASIDKWLASPVAAGQYTDIGDVVRKDALSLRLPAILGQFPTASVVAAQQAMDAAQQAEQAAINSIAQNMGKI